ERSLYIFLSVEDHRRGFDYAIFRLHGGLFDDAATEVTFQQSHATFGAERLVGWTEYRIIQAFGGRITPDNFAIFQERLFAIRCQTTLAHHCLHIVMEQARQAQFADQVAHAANCLEAVDISQTVGVDTAHQGGDVGNIRQVLPVNINAGSTCDRHDVDSVVG